jgi:hypothetical protein
MMRIDVGQSRGTEAERSLLLSVFQRAKQDGMHQRVIGAPGGYHLFWTESTKKLCNLVAMAEL